MSVLVAAALFACTPPTDDPAADRGLLSGTPTGGSVTTGDTSTVPVADSDPSTTADTGFVRTSDTAPTADTALSTDEIYDCSQPNPTIGPVSSTGYVTEEDFDFDPRGYLVSQRNRNIEGLDRYGTTKIYATNVGVDAAGLRVLSTGDLAVAQPDTGDVVLVDAKTGGSQPIFSGLSFPNSLAASSDGYVFVAEFASNGRVRMADPYTLEQWPVASGLDHPNGVELSPDEQTLYVTEGGEWGSGDSRIWAIPRISETVWGTPTVFYTPPAGAFLTIGMDVCGNLYIVEFTDGQLYRVSSDGVAEALLDVDNWGSYSSMRFGNGVGGFERDQLFITRRAELYLIEVGIPGKKPVYF